MLSYTGNVDKRIRETEKFHQRFVMLRGFNLYWFRVDNTANSGKFKQKLPIPSIPIVKLEVPQSSTSKSTEIRFEIKKQEELVDSKTTCFRVNKTEPDFLNAICAFCNLRRYIEDSQRHAARLDPLVTMQMVSNIRQEQFDESVCLHLRLEDTVLTHDFQINPMLHNFKIRNWNMISVTLSRCQLQDRQFELFLRELDMSGLQQINVEDNRLSEAAISALETYLKQTALMPVIQSLVLSKNKFFDGGIQKLAEAIARRSQNSSDVEDSQILEICIADTCCGDAGMKTLFFRLQEAAIHYLKTKADDQCALTIDISNNQLTELSVKPLFDSMRKVSLYRSIKMKNCLRTPARDQLWLDLARALQSN